MSRRSNLKSRDSVFVVGPDRGEIQAQCPPDLLDCVVALENCCQESWEAQVLLRRGTQDFPRMIRIIESQRLKLFLLVNEETVKRYKADLVDEIEPSITELIERTESGLRDLTKQAHQLQKKVEVAQLRPALPAGTTMASQKVEARRLQALKKQREKLEAEARQLEVEVEGLERQVLSQ